MLVAVVDCVVWETPSKPEMAGSGSSRLAHLSSSSRLVAAEEELSTCLGVGERVRQ